MAKKEKPTHKCRDCAHAYDFHEMSARGVPFLCKCPYQTRSMFLNYDCCDKFKRKN